jgi:anti-sigma28 factor (negative regulator of flagellin synthesis)
LNRASALRYDAADQVESADALPADAPYPAVNGDMDADTVGDASSADANPRMTGSGDMDVQGPNSVDRARPVPPSSAVKSQPPQAEPAASSEPAVSGDRVELSPEARAAEEAGRASGTGELRTQRLARIKAEIEAGTYDTPDKLEQALSLLFAEVGVDDEQPAE